MLSIKEQKYLITTARANYSRTIKAINESDYYRRAYSEKAEKGGYADMMQNDIADFHIILNETDDIKAWNKYTSLDTSASDEFITIIKNEYGYIESDELIELSGIILNYKAYLERSTAYMPESVYQAIDKELKHLTALNTMLCDYAKKGSD